MGATGWAGGVTGVGGCCRGWGVQPGKQMVAMVAQEDEFIFKKLKGSIFCCLHFATIKKKISRPHVATELISTQALGTIQPADQARGLHPEAGPSLKEHTLQRLPLQPRAWEA